MTPHNSPREALHWLRSDLRSAPGSFLVNTLAASPLIPRVLRSAIYRSVGIDMGTNNIAPFCRFAGWRTVVVGPRTYVNMGVTFEGGAPLTIGSDCLIAMNATFATSTHAIDAQLRFSPEPECRPIRVGDRCWVGAGAFVGPGVTVVDDCIIGAGAVVTKSCLVPGIYVGVPARLVRSPDGASIQPQRTHGDSPADDSGPLDVRHDD